MKKRLLLEIGTVALAGAYVINDEEFKLAFDRYFHFPDFIYNHDIWDDMNKATTKGLEFIDGVENEYIWLRNSMNNIVSATFIPSKVKSKKYMILSHGYRSDGLHEFGAFLPFYYEQNVNLLIVDHQAHGRSEGRYITFGYQEHKDLLQWAHYLVENYGEDIEIYMHGISMGAATVCQCSGCEELPKQVKGIISDCAYSSASEQLIHVISSWHVPFAKMTYKLVASKLEKVYGAKLEEVNALDAVKNCKVPIFFIHGTKDQFVPTDMGIQIFEACRAPEKDLILIEKAGHAQSYYYGKDKYQQAILDVINKFSDSEKKLR